MSHTQALNAALLKGAAYLQNKQLPDGSFTITMEQGADQQLHDGNDTSFVAVNAHIALALHPLPHAQLQASVDQLLQWLESQCVLLAPPKETMSGPSDIFTACSTLLALYEHRPTQIPASTFGRIAQMLVSAESQIGGPYYTVCNDTSRSIDFACNTVIARLLAAVAEPLPNLTHYLDTAIKHRSYTSLYHSSPLATIHILAHSRVPIHSQLLIRYLRTAYQAGKWRTALDMSLGLSSLAALGAYLPEEAILQLLHQQQDDGSWPASPCCKHPADQQHAYGAAALTTACALQALAAYKEHYHSPITQPAKPTSTLQLPKDTLYEAVTTQAHQHIAHLPQPLRHTMEHMVSRIRRADTNQEIVLLPLFMAQSLATPHSFRAETYTQLGLANLYNWMAYTIYDDFLDSEGEPPLLPVANVALRYSLQAFRQALPGNQLFQQIVASTFDTIDSANAWEVARCRFPVHNNIITIQKLPAYGRRSRLAERSLSHSLPALGILHLAGFDLYDARVIACHTAFKHYLIARQLNDDMHDWEEDIRAGQISYVVRTILDELQVPAGPVHLDRLIPRMKRQFWNVTLARICNDITYHTSHGKQALTRSKLLNELNIIHQLLTNLEGVVAHSLDEQQRANDFLRAYKQK